MMQAGKAPSGAVLHRCNSQIRGWVIRTDSDRGCPAAFPDSSAPSSCPWDSGSEDSTAKVYTLEWMRAPNSLRRIIWQVHVPALLCFGGLTARAVPVIRTDHCQR